MVQAILAGHKTQTRRVIKPQPTHHYDGMVCVGNDCQGDRCEQCIKGIPCPGRELSYWFDMGGNEWACGKCGGEVIPLTGGSKIRANYIKGDIMWVRETWRYCKDLNGICFKASPHEADNCKKFASICEHSPTWKPSIHMRREAARIFLRVTDVRAERLQDITGKDVMSEGVNPVWYNGEPVRWENEQRAAYHKLWDSLNAKRSFGWDANPWVWVYTFEKEEPPK